MAISPLARQVLEIKREAEQKKELYPKKADSVKPKVFSGKGI